jgi:DNA-binding LytR/AlgR family response regulator
MININIAVCDDEQRLTEYIKMLVSKWADENNIKINIEMFDSAENFKSARSENKDFDILLLDIQMNGQNGVELAKELRKYDNNLIIIFITALPDYMNAGYDVSALHYLIKPIDEAKFFEILDKAYKNITGGIKKFLIINSDNKDYSILFDDIVYIEALRNYTNIVTVDDSQYETKQPISNIEKELDESFFRCQRSYIIMLKHIKYISKTDVLLNNGKKISLSRNIYKDLYGAFVNYFKSERKDK